MKTPTRKPEARSVKVQKIGGSTVIWFTVGKLTTAYRVTAIPHQFGKAAFRLDKADQGDGAPESYDVLLDGPFSTCDCVGFSYHGMKAANGTGCKHVAGLQAALNAGQLQAAPKPEPKPEASPFCPGCGNLVRQCDCTI